MASEAASYMTREAEVQPRGFVCRISGFEIMRYLERGRLCVILVASFATHSPKFQRRWRKFGSRNLIVSGVSYTMCMMIQQHRSTFPSASIMMLLFDAELFLFEPSFGLGHIPASFRLVSEPNRCG